MDNNLKSLNYFLNCARDNMDVPNFNDRTKTKVSVE